MPESRGATIGRRIQELREARFFSRQDLAERSGLTYATLHHIEHGTTARPRRSSIEKVAAVLGVSVEELIGLDGPGPQGPPPAPPTPRTDERDEAFIARFEWVDEVGAGALRSELDEELTGLQGYLRRLRDEGADEEGFALRMARGKLARCVRRLSAATLLWTDLGFGRERKPYEEYAGAPDELERFLREEQERRSRKRQEKATG